MKLWKIAFIITYLISSLTLAAGPNCIDGVEQILKVSQQDFQSEVISRISKSEFFSQQHKEKLLAKFNSVEIHPELRVEFLEYLEYLESYRGMFHESGIEQISNFKSKTHFPARIASPLARFRKAYGKVKKFDQKINKEKEKEIALFSKRLKDPKKRHDRITEITNHYSNKKQLYRDLQYGCMKHQARYMFKQANTMFSAATPFLGTVSPVFVYPALSMAVDKEGVEWGGPYGTEVAYTVVQNFLFYKYIIHLGNNFLKTSAISYGYYVSLFSLYRYFVYDGMFGLEPQAEKLLKQMKIDGFEEEMQKVLSRTENMDEVQKIISELNKSMAALEVNGGNLIDLWEQGKLNDEEATDAFMEILMRDIYEKQHSGMIKTGQIWSDHVAAFAINDLGLIFIDVFASKAIMNVLCSNLPNKKVALMKSLSAYFAWSLTYNASLYGFRIYSTGSLK